MRLHLEAEPEDLQQRGQLLVRQLAKAVRPHAPHLAEQLLKAAEDPPGRARHHIPAIQDGMESIHALYGQCLANILREFGGVLDAQVEGTLAKADGGPFIGPRGGKWADPAHTIPWEPPGEGRAPAQEKPTKERPKRTWVEDGAAFGLPHSTKAAHQVDGEYTPARQKMHRDVEAQFLNHVPVVPDDARPIAVVMMGGSGAGKGTLLKHMLGDAHDFVNVNSDDCKELIPEYKRALHLETPNGVVSVRTAAAMAHDESSDMADGIRAKAMAARKNLILDGTGKDADGYAKKIKALKDKGYVIRLMMPHVGIEEARQRVKDRADRSGRYVPDEFVEQAHHIIPGNFQKIAAHADEAVLFDNDKPPPRPVWKITPEGENVMDQGFVDEFKKVGAERHQIARAKAWMKSLEARMEKAAANDKRPPVLSLDEMLERMKVNRGEAPDTCTGLDYDLGNDAHVDDDVVDKSFVLTSGIADGTPSESTTEAVMEKSHQMFIGPNGGRWADAAHTISWKPETHAHPLVQKLLQSAAAKTLDEVRPYAHEPPGTESHVAGDWESFKRNLAESDYSGDMGAAGSFHRLINVYGASGVLAAFEPYAQQQQQLRAQKRREEHLAATHEIQVWRGEKFAKPERIPKDEVAAWVRPGTHVVREALRVEGHAFDSELGPRFSARTWPIGSERPDGNVVAKRIIRLPEGAHMEYLIKPRGKSAEASYQRRQRIAVLRPQVNNVEGNWEPGAREALQRELMGLEAAEAKAR